MKARRNRTGFTLLEIVLSITVLALMALMLTRLFGAGTGAVRRARQLALLDETARLVLDHVQQDISQALIRTNLPFRVYTSSGRDELYFVSPAVRRMQTSNPRDTAPVRLRTARRTSAENGLVPDLNRYIQFKYPTGTSGRNALRSLARQSNVYHAEAVATDGSMAYTDYLVSRQELSAHASLTFFDLLINGRSASNFGRSRLPDPADMPRFVDAVLGLAASTDLQQAMRIHDARGAAAAQEFLAAHERVYTRRILLRNTGTDPRELQP